eukprot:6167427-Pyramimonas_sp.AAC.1
MRVLRGVSIGGSFFCRPLGVLRGFLTMAAMLELTVFCLSGVGHDPRADVQQRASLRGATNHENNDAQGVHGAGNHPPPLLPLPPPLLPA